MAGEGEEADGGARADGEVDELSEGRLERGEEEAVRCEARGGAEEAHLEIGGDAGEMQARFRAVYRRGRRGKGAAEGEQTEKTRMVRAESLCDPSEMVKQSGGSSSSRKSR